MKPPAFLSLAFVAVWLLAGCGVPGGTAPTVAVTKAAGSSATLGIDPNPPSAMQEVTLRLTLRDAQDRPLSGATVQLDLTMPGMQMPVNRPQVMEVGDGVYQARALLTMAGEWQVRADVSSAGGREEFTFALRTK
jgi:nitrogen fixation protein FixH